MTHRLLFIFQCPVFIRTFPHWQNKACSTTDNLLLKSIADILVWLLCCTATFLFLQFGKPQVRVCNYNFFKFAWKWGNKVSLTDCIQVLTHISKCAVKDKAGKEKMSRQFTFPNKGLLLPTGRSRSLCGVTEGNMSYSIHSGASSSGEVLGLHRRPVPLHRGCMVTEMFVCTFVRVKEKECKRERERGENRREGCKMCAYDITFSTSLLKATVFSSVSHNSPLIESTVRQI